MPADFMLTDILIYRQGNLIARLHPRPSTHENLLWTDYEPQLLAISESDFAAHFDLRKNPQDIPLIFEFTDTRKQHPFHHFMAAWNPSHRRVRLKFCGPSTTRTPSIRQKLRRLCLRIFGAKRAG
jgi:hypothetical protein